MEEYSERRSKTEIAFLRRGSRTTSTNQTPQERTDHQIYRPGSSTRLNPMKTGMANNQERPRYLSDSFKSSTSKVAPAGSSKFPLTKFEEKRRQPLLAGVDIAESSRRKANAKHLDNSKKVIVEDENSDTLQSEPEDFTTEQGHSLAPDPEGSHFAGPSGVSAHTVESLVRSASLSSRTHRQKDKQVNLGTPGACSSSLSNRSTMPGISAIGVKPSYGYVSGVQRRGLRNFASTSVPDVQPSGCPSASVHNRRFEAMRKRASDGEGSSRSRSLNGPVSLGHSCPTCPRDTGPRVRTTEHPLPQQIIRGSSKNHQDSAVSVRTRRSSPQHTRLRVSEQREDRMLSLHDSSARNQQSDQSHFPFEEVSSERSIRPFSLELPHEIYSSSRRGLNTRAARQRQSSLFEESPPRTFHGFLRESDNHRHITMEGITEVLVALERIEQEAELSYEQFLVLETNLFLGAFASHDQHREMRMDIDSMSYEELLALEERIGSVSTALSQEQFAKCLRRSIYNPAAAEVEKSVVADLKCSICQEEYMEGEEVGRLPCEHQYHVCCIHQWLRQKNWCPVCKASAVPSME